MADPALREYVVPLPSGFDSLDRVCTMAAGTTTVLAGRTKSGKSQFLSTLVRNFAKAGRRDVGCVQRLHQRD